jgi:hypothetical protein
MPGDSMVLVLDCERANGTPWLSNGGGLTSGGFDRQYFLEGRGLPDSERSRNRSDHLWAIALVDIMPIEEIKELSHYLGAKVEYHSDYNRIQREEWFADEKRFAEVREKRKLTNLEVEELYFRHHNSERYCLCSALIHPDKMIFSRDYSELPEDTAKKLKRFFVFANLIHANDIDYLKNYGIEDRV